MNDAVDLGMLGEDFVEGLLIGHVHVVEDGSLAADEFDAVERDLGRIVEVISDDDIVVVLEKSKRGERPDIASATDRGQSGDEEILVRYQNRKRLFYPVTRTVPTTMVYTLRFCRSFFGPEPKAERWRMMGKSVREAHGALCAKESRSNI